MTKLGIRVGWPMSPRLQLSAAFESSAEQVLGTRISRQGLDALELACNRLMEERRKQEYDACAGPTEKALERWEVAYAALEAVICHPSDVLESKPSKGRGSQPEYAAAWSYMAECADASRAARLPDLRQHFEDIKMMRFLAEKARAKVQIKMRSGRDRDDAVRIWIAAVATALRGEGVAITRQTRRGAMVAPCFGKALDLLRSEMAPNQCPRVFLPGKKQLAELSREVVISDEH